MAPTLFGTRSLAFRDVGFFYTPLYEYVAAVESQTYPAKWNDFDGVGMPIDGEVTTAVWYPLRTIVYRCFNRSGVAIAAYVTVHLWLSVFAIGFLVRHLRDDASSRAIATSRLFASIAYPLSGGVFFLYCNPVFLVSAAWLPAAAVLWSKNFGRTSRHRGDSDGRGDSDDRGNLDVWITSVAIAAMVLGGDPQTALHVVMVAVAVWGCRWTRTVVRPKMHQWSGARIRQIVTVVSIAGLAASPQIVSGVGWAWQSDRDRLSDQMRFRYSVPALHLAEVVTPFAWGTIVPTHRRISHVIEGEHAMWTPTLFAGTSTALITIASLLSQLRQVVRRRSSAPLCEVQRTRPRGGQWTWLWIAAGAFAMAMGESSLADGWFGGDALEPIVNGFRPYVVASRLPGYNAFRYPAKWLPIATLGVVMHAAIHRSTAGRSVGMAASAMGLMLVGLSVCIWMLPETPTADPFWGPLDHAAARRMIAASCIATASVLALYVAVFRWAPKRSILAISFLTAIEMAIVAAMMLYTVPADNRISPRVDRSNLHTQTSPETDRWVQYPAKPETDWIETISVDRVSEIDRWARGNWFGRWYLSDRVRVVNGMMTMSDGRIVAAFNTYPDADRLASRCGAAGVVRYDNGPRLMPTHGDGAAIEPLPPARMVFPGERMIPVWIATWIWIAYRCWRDRGRRRDADIRVGGSRANA